MQRVINPFRFLPLALGISWPMRCLPLTTNNPLMWLASWKKLVAEELTGETMAFNNRHPQVCAGKVGAFIRPSR